MDEDYSPPNMKYSTKSTDKSMKLLEKTRSKTQELLSPSLIPKIKNFIKKYKNKLVKATKNKDADILKQTKNKFSLKNKFIYFKNGFVNLFQKIYAQIKGNINSFTKKTKENSTKIQNEETIKLKIQKLNIFETIKNFIFKQKKLTIIFIILFCVISIVFIVSIQAAKKSKEEKLLLQNYQADTQEINDQIIKAESNILYKAENKAVIYMTKAESLIQTLGKNYGDESTITDLEAKTNEFNQKLAALKDEVRHIVKISNPNIMFDLQNTPPITEWEKAGDKIIIFGESLDIFDLKSKQTENISFSLNENEKFIDGTVYHKDANIFVLLTDADQVYALDLSKKELTKMQANISASDVKDIKSYNAYIYGLDPANSQVLKYKKSYNTVNAGTNWITDANISLAGAKELYIDGSIYILFADGNINNFLNGTKTSFKINKNIDPEISGASRFVYSEKTKTYYVLEPQAKRIITFDSTGKFLKQYTSDSFDDLIDLEYDESSNSILVLNKNRIYSISEK